MTGSAAEMPLGPLTLEGGFVRLEPLAERHFADLAAAAADPAVWRWLPTHSWKPAEFRAWFTSALALDPARDLPFAVVERSSGRAVGSTRYLDLDPVHRGVEIGWTWYAPTAQGTAVNPESKLLLMTHAFEDWGALRVFFKTDSENARSRAALLKLGARFEGELRNHRVRPDGTMRHSAYFSVLPEEWPAVKAALVARLAGYSEG